MDRRLGLWVSAVGGLLAVTLVGAPIWDSWRYRSLRAPLGPHVPVGVILPLRPLPPPLPPQSPERQASPMRSVSVVAAEPRPVTIPAVPPERAGWSAPRPDAPIVVPVQDETAPAPHPPQHRVTAPPALAARKTVSAVTAPAPAPVPTRSPIATELQTGGDPSAAPQGSGWIAVPAVAHPTAPPPPESDPEPGQPTTNTPVTHGGGGGGSSRGTPPENPTLALVLPSTSITVGDAVNVTVHLSDASNVSSVPFHVEFDPAILEFQSASQGSGVAGLQPILLADVNPTRPGDLAVGLSLVESSGLLQGSGAVVRLQFRALAPGVSALDFSRASVRSRTGEALDARFQNALVEVH
jgi:hypothetical protein